MMFPSWKRSIKHRQSFPNDDAAMKLIFMGLKNISKKWTMPIQNGVEPLQYLRVLFEKAPHAASAEDWDKLLPWNIFNS